MRPERPSSLANVGRYRSPNALPTLPNGGEIG